LQVAEEHRFPEDATGTGQREPIGHSHIIKLGSLNKERELEEKRHVTKSPYDLHDFHSQKITLLFH
jgi:hypothetical protein